MKTKPNFFKSILKILFINFFWEGLGASIIFLLMIPAMVAGQIPIWLAIIISIIMGFFGVLLSNTYDKIINPFKRKN